MTLKPNLTELMRGCNDWTRESLLHYVIKMRKELQQLKKAKHTDQNFDIYKNKLIDEILGAQPK